MGLRVALLGYRGDPRSGGQGVYLQRLGRELVRLGHDVTVLAGPPYPDIGVRAAEPDGMRLIEVPSLELYVPPGPFRTRAWARMRAWPDVVEFALMFAGRFPEPRTFTMRVARLLRHQRAHFDIVHDNQSFGVGLLELQRAGWPVIATMHHPLTIDLGLALDHLDDRCWEPSIRRWYSFIEMQKHVAARLPRILTVSETARSDIVEHMEVPCSRVSVVPVGADPELFAPLPGVARVSGRILTTASADVPLKGLVPLLEALARVRSTRAKAHLVVVARAQPAGAVADTIDRLGLGDAVTFVSGLSDRELVKQYAEAEVGVVPSLYEGFSLPAVEAMSCGVPLVATTGGALPEVVGRDNTAALLVPPGDPAALAVGMGRVLDDPELGRRLGRAGRERVLERFTWRRCAAATVERYHEVIERTSPPGRAMLVGGARVG
ncbi:MAG: glycosyltransferase family 4 protein [Actinobacteria bacterium]|nr:glycosyltransferase family 4 protein [Actinomycetota bacterium]